MKRPTGRPRNDGPVCVRDFERLIVQAQRDLREAFGYFDDFVRQESGESRYRSEPLGQSLEALSDSLDLLEYTRTYLEQSEPHEAKNG